MEIECYESGSKICKGKGVKLISSVSRFEDCDIPEWLLIEVLIRLPAKIVFRLKLVSKQWLSLISSPFFVRAYGSRASLFPQPWTIIPHDMPYDAPPFPFFSVPGPGLEYGMLEDLCRKPSYCLVAVPSIHQQREQDHYVIFAVSNGLLLYGLNDQEEEQGCVVMRSFHICNPLTGQCIALPPLNCCFTDSRWGFITNVEDGFLKSYRVVLPEFYNQPSNSVRFQIFLSENGEWKTFNVSCTAQNLVSSHRQATSLNGIMHWVTRADGIMAFDTDNHGIHNIAFPAELQNRQRQTGFNSLCFACQGKLRYFEIFSGLTAYESQTFRIWVLDDYISGNWCLQHKVVRCMDVQYDADSFPSKIFLPMAFHPYDPEIIYLLCGSDCVTCNLKTRKLELVQNFRRHAGRDVDLYFSYAWNFVLVFPPWPISIPNHIKNDTAENVVQNTANI